MSSYVLIVLLCASMCEELPRVQFTTIYRCNQAADEEKDRRPGAFVYCERNILD